MIKNKDEKEGFKIQRCNTAEFRNLTRYMKFLLYTRFMRPGKQHSANSLSK